MAQISRPVADGVTTGWATHTGATSNLYTAVDDVSTDDTDYIASAAAPSNSTLRLQLDSGLTDPVASGGHIVSARMAKSASGGGTIAATLKLYQGGTSTLGSGTLIATINSADVPALGDITSSFTTYTYTLADAEADAITDYTDLWLEITANQV